MSDATYDSVDDMIRAFTRRFLDLSGEPAAWKGYVFAYRDDEETIRVMPFTGNDGKGKWHITLSTPRDDFEIQGSGELTPPRVRSSIGKLRALDAARLRVDKEDVAEQLGKLADAVARAQAVRKSAVVRAVREQGLSKVAAAEAARISRPTLDAWLAEHADDRDPRQITD